MQITLKFNNNVYRTTEYYLRRRYKSKANLEKLARLAIAREVASEAEKELDEINKSLDKV